MQNDIRLYSLKGLGTEETIQGSFEIANNYKAKLAEEISAYQFPTVREEIFYFRELQPLFIAEAEFYTYCYHVELFRLAMAETDLAEFELFCKRQLLRMEKFERENREIYDYLKTGNTEMDEEWFTRIDEGGESIYNKQVGTYMAIRRFEEFMKKELAKLGITMDEGGKP